MTSTQPILTLYRLMKNLLWLICSVAMLYLGVLLLMHGSLHNAGLVALLVVNSLIVIACFKHLSLSLPAMPDDMFGGARQQYFLSVFSPLKSALTGVAWGLLFGVTVYAGNLIPQQELNERIFFALFLGAHNILIGMAVYALCMHLYWCFTVLGENVSVSLWDRSSEDAVAYFKVNRSITFTVAGISALALIGVYSFSDICTACSPIFLFTGICLVITAFTYLVPLLPLSRRLRHLKDQELHVIGKQLDCMYKEVVQLDRDTLEACETLRKLSKRVEGAPTFPPVQGRAYETMVISTVLTQLPNLPAVLKHILGPLH